MTAARNACTVLAERTMVELARIDRTYVRHVRADAMPAQTYPNLQILLATFWYK